MALKGVLKAFKELQRFLGPLRPCRNLEASESSFNALKGFFKALTGLQMPIRAFEALNDV